MPACTVCASCRSRTGRGLMLTFGLHLLHSGSTVHIFLQGWHKKQMREKRIRIGLSAVLAGLGLIWVSAEAQSRGSQWHPKDTEWAWYTADMAGTKYRPLDQINASNFNKLEIAWRFKTDNLGSRPEYKLEGTPLMVNGSLYTTGGTRRSVISLDAKTGEVNWVYNLHEGNRAVVAARQLSGRGVAYWSDGRGDDRVLYVSTGYRLMRSTPRM